MASVVVFGAAGRQGMAQVRRDDDRPRSLGVARTEPLDRQARSAALPDVIMNRARAQFISLAISAGFNPATARATINGS